MFQREMLPQSKRRAVPTAASDTAESFMPPMESAAPSTSGARFDFGSIAIFPPEPQIGPAGGELGSRATDRIQRQQGGGVPIDVSTQRRMEEAFGHSFADVRIHADSESDDLNRSMGASAFTFGSDIFLGQKVTNAGTGGGERILAHELAHVVQQQGAAQSGRLVVGAADAGHEQEADTAAMAVSRGSLAGDVTGKASELIVQRFPAMDLPAISGSIPAVATGGVPAPHIVPDAISGAGRAMPETGSAAAKAQADEKFKQAILLDLKYHGLFAALIADRTKAIWKITHAFDAAGRGFSDAQIAQAQTDQMEAQLIGAIAQVGFAAGFEWAFAPYLGKFATATRTAKEVIEAVENPANAAVSGAANVYATHVANQSAMQGQTPSLAGTNVGPQVDLGGGGSMAFLSSNSATIQDQVINMELAFSKRADDYAKFTEDDWLTFDVHGQEVIYLNLLNDIALAARGANDLKSDDEMANVIEKHLWALWIKSRAKESAINLALSHGADSMPGWDPEQVEVDGGDVAGLGSDVEKELNKIGVADEASVELSEHWYRLNSPGWPYKLYDWAVAYNETITIW